MGNNRDRRQHMRKFIGWTLAVGSIFAVFSGCRDYRGIPYPYTQEYEAGQGNIKGNVDTERFSAADGRFAIGANENGYAVFKEPEQAFEALCEKYADGISRIQRDFGLEPLTPDNYADYKTYGWQVKSGTDAEKDQAAFVTDFLDIYENSFQGS